MYTNSFSRDDVGSQTVDFKFQVDIATYIVTNIGAVVFFVDGRGRYLLFFNKTTDDKQNNNKCENIFRIWLQW